MLLDFAMVLGLVCSVRPSDDSPIFLAQVNESRLQLAWRNMAGVQEFGEAKTPYTDKDIRVCKEAFDAQPPHMKNPGVVRGPAEWGVKLDPMKEAMAQYLAANYPDFPRSKQSVFHSLRVFLHNQQEQQIGQMRAALQQANQEKQALRDQKRRLSQSNHEKDSRHAELQRTLEDKKQQLDQLSQGLKLLQQKDEEMSGLLKDLISRERSRSPRAQRP